MIWQSDQWNDKLSLDPFPNPRNNVNTRSAVFLSCFEAFVLEKRNCEAEIIFVEGSKLLHSDFLDVVDFTSWHRETTIYLRKQMH